MVLGTEAGHSRSHSSRTLPSASDERDDGVSEFEQLSFEDEGDTADDHSDAFSVASTPDLSDSHSYTSTDTQSIRSRSPARSVYSLTDSLRENSFRRVHGRTVNNNSEVYLLPADDEETYRLDGQHHMLKALVPGVLGPVDEVLRPVVGVQKAVLDLGTGSAIWAIEMALKYPHVDVVGVDLAPMQTREFPPNCRVEVDDINLGLPHFHGCFDVVHARLISSGIRDYCGLIHEIARILRPGGLILVEEWDFRCYRSVGGADGPNAQYELAPPSTPDRPYSAAVAEWLRLLGLAVRQRGADIDAAAFLKHWISQHGQFEQIGYKDVWIATQPHFTGKDEWSRFRNELAAMMRNDTRLFIRAGQPLLRSYTDDVEGVNRLIEEVEKDLEECKKKLYVRMQCTWARRRPTSPTT